MNACMQHHVRLQQLMAVSRWGTSAPCRQLPLRLCQPVPALPLLLIQQQAQQHPAAARGGGGSGSHSCRHGLAAAEPKQAAGVAISP